MLRSLLHLLALAPLFAPAAAGQAGGGVWEERRAELEALDPYAADVEELATALAELAAEGPTADAERGAWAGKAAYVLCARLRNQGDLVRALEVLDQGLLLCTEPGGARPFLWLASSSLESQLNDYVASVEALDRAEASLDGDQRASAFLASIWSLRAQALIQLGIPDQAAPWVARAVERAESLRGTPAFDPAALIDAYTKRANLRMATNSYERMRDEVEAVLADEALLADNSTARARFQVRLGMAWLWRVRGEDEAASRTREHFGAALDEAGVQAVDRFTAHLRLGQLELLAGQVAEAAGCLERARALATEMGAAAISSADEGLLSALEARVVRLSPEPQPGALAEARDRLRSAYDAQLANWRARPETRGGVGFLRFLVYQDIVAEVVEGELAAAPGEDGRRAALVQLARAQAVGDLAEALGAREPDWSAIAALVPPGGGLLVWLGAPGASHAFAVDAAGTAHGRLGDQRDLQAPREALERLLAQSPVGLSAQALERRRSELDDNATRLGELLLPPALAARVAGWSALTLVADDLVGPCAIELVPLRDARGEVAPLCLSRPVAFLPGLAVGAALAARAATPAVERPYLRDLCLVAGVHPSADAVARFPHLSELPIDATLLKRWREPFLDARVEALTGERATLAHLAAAPAARIEHFLTHGVRDEARARPAGLLLTPGADDAGLLFAPDVLTLAAPALVVLSVCSAGRGPERIGDAGASDLSGAFLSAGADAVLLAPTDLPFEPVARWAPRLHAELARGATPAEALWRARLELARDPACADPFHHLAALRVLGLGHRPLFRARPVAAAPDDDSAPEPAPRRFTFGVLIAAAFVLPGWLILRRRRAA